MGLKVHEHFLGIFQLLGEVIEAGADLGGGGHGNPGRYNLNIYLTVNG